MKSLGGFLGILCCAASAVFAAGDDQTPGARLSVDLSRLPAPYAPPSGANGPRPMARPEGALPKVPEGFAVNIFADGLTHARNVKVAANGDVFLAESAAGRITLLRDADGDGAAETVTAFADGFRRPHGIAFGNGALYVADLAGVWSIPFTPGDREAREPRTRLTPEGALGDPGGHYTRNVVLHPDGRKMYVAVGSRGNIAEEPDPRATIQEFNIDGSGQRTYARGLRNPIGLAFYPGTTALFTVVNERDGLGDELVPDYLTQVTDGAFYGWPYSYMGSHPQPKFAEKRPDLVAKAVAPDLPFQAHTAPIEMAFYTAEQFPPAYRGGAFVALHGSWNASQPRGYTVVYVPFENQKPAGHYVVFASGFWHQGESKAEVWGRPAGVAVARDGSLLIADDEANIVWRVSAK